MYNNKECADYFKRQKVYRRCFEELRKKWQSYGKVAGRITLSNASDEERRAIGGIIGKIFYEKSIRFSFAEFEQGLQKTCYAPIDIERVLSEYFGKRIQTTQEERDRDKEQKKAFLDDVVEMLSGLSEGSSVAVKWINKLVGLRKYGYQILIREYGKNPEQAGTLACNVGKALIKTKEMQKTGEEIPLAVFAADITNNPHYFDYGGTAGSLFFYAICCVKETEVPENTHEWRELMHSVGVIPDNVASMVHVYGIHLQKNNEWHPAYEAFCKMKESYVLTMDSLNGITGVKVSGECVYIVENEMVFSYLINNMQNRDFTLLCTSGQPRSAALKLITMILDTGVLIYYSGDIDPDGLGIADRLWKWSGHTIHIWRMSPQDYWNSISGEGIGATGIAKLEHITQPLLQKTAECVKEKGMAGYQENILIELLTDMNENFSDENID